MKKRKHKKPKMRYRLARGVKAGEYMCRINRVVVKRGVASIYLKVEEAR